MTQRWVDELRVSKLCHVLPTTDYSLDTPLDGSAEESLLIKRGN